MSSLESSHPVLPTTPNYQPPLASKAFPFLRLPAETRNQIYHELLVKPGPQAIGELPASYPAQDVFKTSGVDSDTASDVTFFSDLQQYRQSAFTGACRLLHSEASPIFYSSNVFSFTKPSTLYAFLRHLTTLSRLSLRNIQYSTLEEFPSGDFMAALIYLRALCHGMRTLEVIYRQPEISPTGNFCRDFSIHDMLGWLLRLPSYEERFDREAYLHGKGYFAKEFAYRTNEGVTSTYLGLYPVFEPPVMSIQPWSNGTGLAQRLRLDGSTAALEKSLCQVLLAQAREGGEKILQDMKPITEGDLVGFQAVLEKIDAYRDQYSVYPAILPPVSLRTW